MAQPIIPRRAMRTDAREFLLQHSEGEEGTMESLIKWTAVSGAVVVGAYFAYMFAAAARQRVDEGLAKAEQVAADASRVLASTQQALNETQQTVRHLRATVS
jgi:pyrroline-5-carboxylate reductase